MNISDYVIMKSIMDQDDREKGVSKLKGSTIKEIMDKSELSSSRVRQGIKDLIKLGFVDNGLGVKNSKTYILTKEGMKTLKDIKGLKIYDNNIEEEV